MRTITRSEFTYDGLGRRVRIVIKQASGNPLPQNPNWSLVSDRRYAWNGNRLLSEYDTRAPLGKVFFDEGVLDGENCNGPLYYSRDHLGSIREMTDANGALRAQYEYDPFGNRTKLNGNLDADFAFTGHWYHPVTGHNLSPYRAYSPTLGRWLSRDRIGEAGGLNLYQYVGNNPVNGTDPLGLYGYETKFWADLSVNGNWAQRAIAWPLGIIATIVTPDAFGLTGTGTVGFMAGGAVGVNRQWFRGDSCPHDFSFAGHTFESNLGHNRAPDFVTPQLSASFQLNLAWSTEYRPNGDSWSGNFQETNASVGPWSGTYFRNDTWRGIGLA